jgi:enterochelin esterase-like enzyme
LPVKFFMSTGTWSDGNYHSALLKKALEDLGYPLLYLECNEGHSYANWRGKYEQMLGFLFPLRLAGEMDHPRR